MEWPPLSYFVSTFNIANMAASTGISSIKNKLHHVIDLLSVTSMCMKSNFPCLLSCCAMYCKVVLKIVLNLFIWMKFLNLF
jgi:hypothetical protein